jgi:galactokinase
MVDAALRVEGVVGAQLAGAGLGGCMMVLVHSEAVRNLREAMDENYYRPFGKPTSVLGCTPINGSSVLMSG